MEVKTTANVMEWRNIMSDKVEIMDNKSSIIKANSLDPRTSKDSMNTSLVIEENTIYEIDEECMNCLKKEKNMK